MQKIYSRVSLMRNAFTPTQSTLTATLTELCASMRDIDVASLSRDQISLLTEVGNLALANAQEACLLEASEEALIKNLEEQDEAWESDALDHSCEGGEDRYLDSYWESLTDIGDCCGDC